MAGNGRKMMSLNSDLGNIGGILFVKWLNCYIFLIFYAKF